MNTTLEKLIKSIRSKGRYCFTLEEVRQYLQVSPIAANQALYRYQNKGEIALVRKGFYVIIPPEYSHRGMLPAHLFIDDMMEWLDRPYYLGLLSAAALHGAAHQQPMESYVVTVQPSLRNIQNDKISINFITRKAWDDVDIEQKKTDAGYVNVSSSELTALDIIYYLKHVGISRAVTVLSELADELDPDKINDAATRYGVFTVIQRLGYILDVVLEETELGKSLHELLDSRDYFYTALSPQYEKKGDFNPKWKIIHNVDVEPDL
jgi:predicted transcriptional regulator of viral defense system